MDGKKPLFSADAAEEYFSTLLTYYRNTGNDIFKRDNEGRHVSDQIYSAEYQKYLGMQIAMREVLEYFAKFELGDTAIRQQETVTNRNGLNEPLTMDELWKMYDGEEGPVWVKFGTSRRSWPAILDTYDGELVAVFSATTDFLHENDYGKTWLAYRQKPEEGTV